MSVGHVARLLESAGIPTVIIAVAAFEAPLRKMAVPRVLLTPFLLGRPVGPVNQEAVQKDVLRSALTLLDSAAGPTMVHYPKR